jgi:hypothetical protein
MHGNLDGAGALGIGGTNVTGSGVSGAVGVALAREPSGAGGLIRR